MSKKIFEKRQYQDGGPNDRGDCIGFVRALNKEEARKISGITHNFIQFHEISEKSFLERKREAWNNYKMYKDI